ncbi:MAG: DUF4398 domain-containing protein [Gammaproteobacteria bacterium]|nr:DUF4398 domain-containing protein [Gammaproteobacteria bacterium]
MRLPRTVCLLRTLSSALMLGVLCTVAACATPPVQAMSNARQAVQAAREAGAPTHAPRIYAEAKHWLGDAEFALQHWDYARARESAKQALHSARAAILAARKSQAPPAATSAAPPAATAPSAVTFKAPVLASALSAALDRPHSAH